MANLTKLVILATCLALFSAVGCKTKKDRDKEEAAAEATEKERAQQAAQDKAKSDEAAKLQQSARAAELDQQERLRIYKGLEGVYNGFYPGQTGKALKITAKLGVENLPVDLKKSRSATEAEIVAATDAIALGAEISVAMPSNSALSGALPVFTCSGTAIKPDFSRGFMKFVCSPLAGGAARKFKILFSQRAPLTDGETLEIASARLSDDLVKNRISSVDMLQFEFKSDEGEFRGKIQR